MAKRYTDQEIQALLTEPKPFSADYQSSLLLMQKRGHKERQFEVAGVSGNKFVLMLRKSDFNELDFSVILGVVSADSNQVFRLRRYNGKSHEHTNRIEGTAFYDFHIHTATERYQDLGAKEDHFAEATNRYGDINAAIACLMRDCCFVVPPSAQTNLFEGMTL